MDHSGHTGTTMAMAGTPTGAAMPTTSAMGGHSMGGMGGGSGCKISMLFNLNTIDACFLSSQWKITSSGMFAGSCIGVFFLAMALEGLRRSIKEYDRFLVRQHLSKSQSGSGNGNGNASTTGSLSSKDGATIALNRNACAAAAPPFRPNVWQQGIRAFLHLLAFFVGYILMLLAMYYNGYILICIFLGAFLGAFIFQWETLTPG
ncbi:Copper Transporter integral membrane protein that functions in high affinity copper transport [Conoideocrella luteorostrata]|uniref:Copper transport protein n=1 Tax=Conoideocrella luteorostrata TaxID=1105319 RepID=A0AAJ0CHF5_9HYPO|nr:Copper Transporter integral membrane protein that functions in high affinity copper transport [Conoideocrella luteorostrata]